VVSATPKETTIAKAIVTFLRSLPRSWARKVHGGPYGNVGEPDIDACINGRTVKIEVKRPGAERTVTANQRVAIERWERAGAVAFVATSVEEVQQRLASEGILP